MRKLLQSLIYIIWKLVNAHGKVTGNQNQRQGHVQLLQMDLLLRQVDDGLKLFKKIMGPK